jgi:geranylgeranyl diphosphate synthase type II
MTPNEHFLNLSEQVQEALSNLGFPEAPADLYDPARYILAAGGKRIRPVCVLLAAEMFGVPVTKAMPAALAVEVFHNFTLVHDDIMDKADSRRGRPTVHLKWNEPIAILSGDLLMGRSFDLLAQLETPHLASIIRHFYQMVEHLCEGQTLDMAFESRFDVTVADYLAMIGGKTAALLETALILGSMIGNADAHQISALQQLGNHIGMGFQVQDDLLDLVAEKADFGKKVGGDLIQGKRTWLLLTAIERAQGEDKAWFEQILHQGLPESAIPEARSKMESLQILGDAKKLCQSYYQNAISCIQDLPKGHASTTLLWLIDSLQSRKI